MIEGYEGDLGPYEAVWVDGSEPIGWGQRIVKYIGEDRFEALRDHGTLKCITDGKWVLVMKWLSEQEAKKKYGKRTNVEVGPRGGFRSVTYGSTTFRSPHMRPKSLP